MKCIVCGINEAKYENLCESCFLDKTRFVTLPKSINITICPQCGAVKIKKSWDYNNSLEEVLQKYFTKTAQILHNVDKLRINVQIPKNMHRVITTITVHYAALEKVEQFNTKLIMVKNSCPRCNKVSGSYFESILQIRANRVLSYAEKQELIERVYKEVQMQKNAEIFILRYEEMRTGLDFYISDNHFTKLLTRKLKAKYGGTIKQSPHLYGRKNGENVYRVTYVLRLPEYRIGDFIKSNNNRYKIVEINSNGLKLQDISNGNIKSITEKSYRDEHYVLFARREMVKKAILIASERSWVQIMDYANNIYELPRPSLKLKQDLNLVVDGENIYIVPD